MVGNCHFDIKRDQTINSLHWMIESLLLCDFHYIAFTKPSDASYEITH